MDSDTNSTGLPKYSFYVSELNKDWEFIMVLYCILKLFSQSGK